MKLFHGKTFSPNTKIQRLQLAGTLGERLLVIVDWSDLQVVAGISFGLFPKTSSLYVGYMITDKRYRGHGFMKVLLSYTSYSIASIL